MTTKATTMTMAEPPTLTAAAAAPPFRERGSLSVFVAVIAPVLFLLCGLVVDGGGRLLAMERAREVAQEAARAGGEEISVSQLLAGNGYVLDSDAVKAAVAAYLSRVSAEGGDRYTLVGSPTVKGTQVTVTLSTVYHTSLLDLIHVNAFTVTTTGSAEFVHGVSEPEAH